MQVGSHDEENKVTFRRFSVFDFSDLDDSQNRTEFDGEDLPTDLRDFSFEFNIKNQTTSSLLKIPCKNCGETVLGLPSEARTLLKTSQRATEISTIGGGQYWHNGLKNALQCISG